MLISDYIYFRAYLFTEIKFIINCITVPISDENSLATGYLLYVTI